MSNITEAIVTIASLVVGVALLALIVSRNSNTTGVLNAASTGFGNILGVAVSPVTGASMTGNVGGIGGFPAFN